MPLAVGVLVAVAAVLVAGAVGFVLGRARRAADGGGHATPEVAHLVQQVVVSSRRGVVLLDRTGHVAWSNPRAAELGLVHAAGPDERAAKAAERALATDAAVSVDLSPLKHRRGGPTAVLGEARPLDGAFTVVDADDESDAVRLEATRRDFVANVSHELKTPVGAVTLLAEAVLDAADDPDEVRRFAGRIADESARLGALVTELIALSRLEGAERLPDPETVEVDRVVEDALARCRAAAERGEIEITVDEPTGMQVSGDATLLVTALSNLIDNAVSYSHPGSPVSVSRRAAGGFVEIAVTDRGMGIAPEHQDRVFERFFRVDAARSRATGGTGLGLAIVKHVAANHGGDVRLWSRAGTGSTFTLRLPAQRDHAPAAPAASGRIERTS